MRDKARSGSVSILPFFLLLFVALKLTGYINWSWWWVLSPLWVPFAAVVVCCAGVFVMTGKIR
jgi:membrane protein YdbS with pleckstrin-like domain